MQKQNLWIAIVIGLAFVLGLGAAGHAYTAKGEHRSVEVTGSAKRQISADVASWYLAFSLDVSTSGLSSGSKTMKDQLDLVQKFLGSHGVAGADVQVIPLSVNPRYSTVRTPVGQGGDQYVESQQLDGYTLSQSVTVNSKDVSKVTAAASDSGKLLESGIILSSQPVQYLYSKLAELRVEMLAEAAKDATAKAQAIVGNAHGSLGGLRSADAGVIQISPRNSVDISDYGSYDTSAVEKDITAIVHANYSVR